MTIASLSTLRFAGMVQGAGAMVAQQFMIPVTLTDDTLNRFAKLMNETNGPDTFNQNAPPDWSQIYLDAVDGYGRELDHPGFRLRAKEQGTEAWRYWPSTFTQEQKKFIQEEILDRLALPKNLLDQLSDLLKAALTPEQKEAEIKAAAKSV